MNNTVHLQEIIGTDKKNPFFTICKSPLQPGKLLVFFGCILLETVENDRNHPSYKLLAARLYNSGIRANTLVSALSIPYTSLRRYGEILKSGDPDKLLKMLIGRKANQKITPEILSFSKQRFFDIYPDEKYRYSQQIRREIFEVFEETICGESLRPLFTEWKKQLEQELIIPDKHTEPEEPEEQGVPELPMIKPTFEGSNNFINDHILGIVDSTSARIEAFPENNRKSMVDLSKNDDYQFCHHSGVLIFTDFLNQFRNILGKASQWISQWIVSLLLGATNIEQTKLLSHSALGELLGSAVSNLNRQRQALGELAMSDCLGKLLQLNGQWVNVEECHDFYYDPHSKHYTGSHKTLKGWCSRLRFAEKVLHMDFIHTVTGYPVYISHDDNFYDLRERYFDVIKNFRLQFDFDITKPLTFVIDRGLYSEDVFKKINSDEDENYFVTWEKGYQRVSEASIIWQGDFKFYKAKNNSRDLKCYSFKYIDELWSKNNNIRRLIVQAINPKGNSIQVSILTNQFSREAQELIELMFSRWIQENDFKYLDIHFGINEITSYGVIPYAELEKTLNDRQVKNGVYLALEKQRSKISKQLKGYLLREHRSKKESTKRQQNIDKLTLQLEKIEEERSKVDQEVSRLDSLIEQGYYKLDTLKKQLMDAIKMTARNLFYLQFQDFKNDYDNYRDDHVLFRHLTHAHGIIQHTDEQVKVMLLTEADYPPKLRKIIENKLNQLNKASLLFPDNSGKVMSIHLLEKAKMKFSLKSAS